MTASRPTRPRVVIVGGGFGGLRAARVLGRAAVDVTVIDRANHHLFQPLLYQVATAVLAPSDIASPIRFLLRRFRNVRVLLGEVVAVDPDAHLVRMDDGEVLPYEYLLLAAGSRHAYFGHDAWEPIAPGLKTIDDALAIRRRFLMAFEEAEKIESAAAREPYLTFVIVGGGPTGVELAGMLPDIARHSMRADFRRVDTRETRVDAAGGRSARAPRVR